MIEIGADGKIKADTLGIKGKDCLPYISMLEKLLDAKTVDSEYTNEYFESEIKDSLTQKQRLREE